MQNFRSFLILFIITGLIGCAGKTHRWSYEPYRLPEGIPYAILNSSIVGPFDEGDNISITTPLDDCETIKTAQNLRSGILFSYKKDQSLSASSIKVPADQPFYIQYSEVRKDGKYCFVHVIVSLEANKNYTLIGGYHTVKGMVPILSDRQGCGIGVINNETGKPVSYAKQLCPE